MSMHWVLEDSKGLQLILLGGIMVAWQCKIFLILEMHSIYR